jgi:hypothetical protein
MKLLSMIVLALAIAGEANADLLTLTPTNDKLEGVSLSSGATANVSGKSVPVTTVGSGLRVKEIFIPIKTYVAQLMVSDAGRFVKTADGALPSMDNQKAVAVYLSFLVNAPNRELVQSISDSLSANGISTSDPDVVEILDKVRSVGNFNKGNSIAIVMTKNPEGTNTVYFENSSSKAGSQFTGSKDLIHKIMSCWLGTPADDGLADLKASLLK